jgi:hypothetical protein
MCTIAPLESQVPPNQVLIGAGKGYGCADVLNQYPANLHASGPTGTKVTVPTGTTPTTTPAGQVTTTPGQVTTTPGQITTTTGQITTTTGQITTTTSQITTTTALALTE